MTGSYGRSSLIIDGTRLAEVISTMVSIYWNVSVTLPTIKASTAGRQVQLGVAHLFRAHGDYLYDVPGTLQGLTSSVTVVSLTNHYLLRYLRLSKNQYN